MAESELDGFRPGHHRGIPHAILGHEGIVDNEGGDFPIGITVEIIAGNFGVFTRAEYRSLRWPAFMPVP